MSRLSLLLALCVAAAPARHRGAVLPTPAQPGTVPTNGFVVVVNAANPITSISRTDLSNIFLKHLTKWPNGTPTTAIDLRTGLPAREAFSKAVLGRSVDAVRSYWQQQIFSGRDVPPPTKGTDAQVLDAVKAEIGAVSYVDAHVDIGQGVKIIPVTNK